MRSLVIALTLALAMSTAASAQADEVTVAAPATVSDDRFELSIVSPRLVWRDREPIEIGATLAYLGEEPATVRHSGGEAIEFEVRQLDGPYRNVWGYDAICGLSEFGPGGVGLYPFRSERLPVGTYQVIAHAQHDDTQCDDIHQLDAALAIEVVADWGPLAVAPHGGAGDAGLGPGTLTIGEDCVGFRPDQGGADVLLVWPADITEWRPQNRRIVMDQRRYGVTRLSDGDHVMLGGVPLTQDTPEETERIRAWLDSSWIEPPDPSCPTEYLFHVGEVQVLDRP